MSSRKIELLDASLRYLVEHGVANTSLRPMAAALGIGIDVEEPVGNMIIDIGGGTTGITVIALAGIVCDQSIRIAGEEFTADIM